MPTIKERLSEMMKASMKSGDKATLAFTRNLHAAIRKKEIDSKADLDDEGVLKIISSQAKQRQDSIEQFQKGGREDLVASERAEFEFLQAFLPPQLGDEELRALVSQAVEESGASGPKEMGKVMKVVLPKIQGRAEGKRVSQMVQEILRST